MPWTDILSKAIQKLTTSPKNTVPAPIAIQESLAAAQHLEASGSPGAQAEDARRAQEAHEAAEAKPVGSGVIGVAKPPTTYEKIQAKAREYQNRKDEWEAAGQTKPAYPQLSTYTEKAVQALKPERSTVKVVSDMQQGVGKMAGFVPGWAPIAVALSNQHVKPAYAPAIGAAQKWASDKTGFTKAAEQQRADWETEEERARKLTESE